MTDTSAATVFGLPAPPSPQLDPYLDAAARCFARHGLRRTRVTDIADEVGVSRVTVYRQVGTTEDAARLLLARELDRLVASLLPKLAGARDADDIVEVIASAVDFAVEHPVMAKVLRDEADLAGAFVISEFGTILDIVAKSSIKRKGQAFVIYDSVDSAQEAVDELSGFELFGKQIEVDFAKTKSDVIVQRDEGEGALEEHKKHRIAEKGMPSSGKRHHI